MVAIPPQVSSNSFEPLFRQAGLARVHQGKVRDTFELPDKDLLLVYASDRISIFDFVLNAIVQDKGAILTALTAFWLGEVLRGKNHLIAFGDGIDEYLPQQLRRCSELQKRSLVVERLKMLPVECIVRGFLTGTGWGSYQKDGTVCGIKLPEGLYDGAALPVPIFTPTTKADSGHDEHLKTEEVNERYPGLQEAALDAYSKLFEYASGKGFLLADTKFEFGEGLVLADEIGTPDSSRFWNQAEWRDCCAARSTPTAFDKEVVRKWGKTIVTPFHRNVNELVVGINKLDPENPCHVSYVQTLVVPEDVLWVARRRYHTIVEALTGSSLGHFQSDYMGIS